MHVVHGSIQGLIALLHLGTIVDAAALVVKVAIRVVADDVLLDVVGDMIQVGTCVR